MNMPLTYLKKVFFLVLFLICEIHSFTIIYDYVSILSHLHDVAWLDISMRDIVDMHEYQSHNRVSKNGEELKEIHGFIGIFNHL